MPTTRFWPVRAAAAHPRALISIIAALGVYVVLPRDPWGASRSVIAWDAGALLLLIFNAIMFAQQGDDATMARNAKAQEEGEWTAFVITLAAAAFSFVALSHELPHVKDEHGSLRIFHVTVVAATLVISWLVTHIIFALRYAHEYYQATADGQDGGLDFPGKQAPDYWDFVYFALVLGMTFQVSDVEITSRKFRRLATVQGLIGFLFNTVIIALTVNIAAGLLG